MTTRLLARPVVLALLVSAPALAIAQTPADRQVRALADSFFSAVAAAHWKAAAATLDLDAFGQFLRQQQESERQFATMPPPHFSAADMMRTDSTMPRVVAEWQAARIAKGMAAASADHLGSDFADVKSLDDLLALTPEQGAARWLEAHDDRYAMRRSWEASGCASPMPTRPVNRESVRGVVVDGDSVAYVIHRPPVDRRGAAYIVIAPSETPEVMIVRKVHGLWKVELQLYHGSGALNRVGTVAGGCPAAEGSRTRSDSALEDLRLAVLTLRTAEEVFFVTENRYTDRVDQLTSVHLPPEITVKSIVLAQTGNGYQMIATSSRRPDTKCGVGIGMANPLDDKTAEGEVVCKP